MIKEKYLDKYNIMFEKSPIGLMTIDETGRVTSVNQYLVNMFGIPDKNIILNYYNFFSDEKIDSKTKDRVKDKENVMFISHIDLTKIKNQKRYYNITRSGTIDVEITIIPFFYNNQDNDRPVNEYLAVIRDISEEVVFEKILDKTFEKLTGVIEELKENMGELERSNNELDQFASVISHDLKKPLISILSFLELLEIDYEGTIDSDDFVLFNDVRNRAKRMSNMIDNLLSYSRLTINAQDFKLCESKEIVKSAVDNLLIDIEQSGADIICDNTLPKVVADEIQMISVFQNLISNGIKFCKTDKPVIRISAEKTNIIDINSIEYTFSITDNGIGFDSGKNGDKIFNMFTRLNRDGKYQGNGIGLAFCKKIIERHNGKIWVKSEKGKGTTFYFTLKGI